MQAPLRRGSPACRGAEGMQETPSVDAGNPHRCAVPMGHLVAVACDGDFDIVPAGNGGALHTRWHSLSMTRARTRCHRCGRLHPDHDGVFRARDARHMAQGRFHVGEPVGVPGMPRQVDPAVFDPHLDRAMAIGREPLEGRARQYRVGAGQRCSGLSSKRHKGAQIRLRSEGHRDGMDRQASKPCWWMQPCPRAHKKNAPWSSNQGANVDMKMPAHHHADAPGGISAVREWA